MWSITFIAVDCYSSCLKNKWTKEVSETLQAVSNRNKTGSLCREWSEYILLRHIQSQEEHLEVLYLLEQATPRLDRFET